MSGRIIVLISCVSWTVTVSGGSKYLKILRMSLIRGAIFKAGSKFCTRGAPVRGLALWPNLQSSVLAERPSLSLMSESLHDQAGTVARPENI